VTDETDKPHNARPAPNDPIVAEYRELMKLAGPDGCKCGIPQCPGHEVIGGRIFMDTHPLGPIIIERPDKDLSPSESGSEIPRKK